MIAFSLVPANLRTPGVFVEFDSSKAVRGLPGQEHRVLLLVQRRTTGTKIQGQLVEVFTADEGKTYFGDGSLGHAMVQRARAASGSVRIFALALDDNAGGTAATGSVTFSGPSTAAGTLYALIAGRAVQTAITSGMTAAQIATAFIAAVNAVTALPGTLLIDGVDTTKANWTSKHKGEIGNECDIRFNFNPGEEFPAGVGATVVLPSGGAGNPSVSTALAAIGDEQFTEIAMPWVDSTNLTALETELLSRWGPMRPIDGHAYAAKQTTVGSLSTFGNSRNSPFVTTLGLKGSPTPAYEMAAVLAAICGEQLQNHPARPLTNLPMPNVLAPATTDRFSRAERDVLLQDGISTAVVAPGGGVAIDRLITMYQLSPAGTVDESYLDLNTLATLSYLRFSFRARMAVRFDRAILADDSNRAGAGQPVVTPKSARGEIVALFDEWERAGLVTDVEQFIADLRVEINPDPVRLDVLLPPNLTNPLLIVAARLEFRK
jgi:phage tail sheath gpL-like